MDIFHRDYAKITFTAIALTLAAAVLPLSGCGEARTGAQAGGAAEAAVERSTADIRVRFDFSEYGAASAIKSLEFTFYDEALEVCFTKTARRSDFERGCLTLPGVPVSVKSMVCLLKDAYGNPVGLSECPELNLLSGATAATELDFAYAAELGERLSLLRLSSPAPVKLKTGERVQLEAEGVFRCRNGAELVCNLTRCSRLVWESSNNSLLRHLGGGRFKALSGGSVKAYAAFGGRQIEADIIVRAAAGTEASGSGAEASGRRAGSSEAGAAESGVCRGDTDPAAIADPEPLPVEAPCSLTLDLSRSCLPPGLSLEVRGYDIDNKLRFRRSGAALKETLQADRSVVKTAGVLLESDGQVYGIFTADVNLREGEEFTVSNPRIISGAELAARGEMVISSDRAVYDLGDEELVYEKNEESGRCVYVYCSAEVRYSIIPGVWAYSSAGDFLEELCSFKAEASETEEYGVFRFFEAGEYTVSVGYRGVTGVFSVEVIDSSSPEAGDYRINIDLSASNLPAGATYELRGFSRRGTLLFSERDLSDLNSVFSDINRNVVKVVGVIKTAGGEPWGMFESNVSLKDGEVYHISRPELLTGERFVSQKCALSLSIPTADYYLEDKEAGGYTAVSVSPGLTCNYGGWSEAFGREEMKDWDGFALVSSPHLEYYSYADKCSLKAYEAGQYAVSASYRGLTSQTALINVFDTPRPSCSLEINFAASGLPADSALISCRLYKGGAALGEEFSRNSAASLRLEGVSSEADGVVIKVKNSSGRLVGMLYSSLAFDADGRAVLNNVKAAVGTGMAAYIRSFSVSPGSVLRNVGECVIASAQAELIFNSGRILQTCDVSAEAVWSSPDMAETAVGNSWRVSRGGELSLTASLGGQTADLKIYASGAGGDKSYRYGEADLNNGRSVGLAIFTPDSSSVRGSFGGKIMTGSAGAQGADFDREELPIDRELLRQTETEGRAESEIEDTDERLFSAKREAYLSGSDIFGINKDEAVRKIDYINAKNGDTISGIYDAGRRVYYDAEVILGNEGITLPNGYRTSGKIIILSEIRDGAPLVDLTNPDELLKVLLIDYMMGKRNPFDKDGLPVLDRMRQDLGHECGYGSGGGVSGLEKVVVSVADLGEGGGIAYTSATNCFPKSIYKNSNECEMITFNYVKYQVYDPASICSNFAHEFSHLVSYNSRSFHDMSDGFEEAVKAYFRRASVLEEGRADLCCFLCGFGIDDRTADFEEFAELTGSGPLPDWASVYSSKASDRRFKAYSYLNQISGYCIKDPAYCGSQGNSTVSNYGQGCFFLAYLYDRCGLASVKKYTESSPYDSEYQDIPEGASHKDYDMLARIVSEAEGRALSFEDIYEEYGRALLLNSVCRPDSIPGGCRLTTLTPGSSHDASFTPEEYRYFGNLPKITPVNKGTSFTENGVVPWSLNYYITPDMSYSGGPSAGIFGLWGSLTSRFRLMLFDRGCTCERDTD